MFKIVGSEKQAHKARSLRPLFEQWVAQKIRRPATPSELNVRIIQESFQVAVLLFFFVRIRKCNHGVSGILLVHYKESLLLNTVHKNVPRLAQS